MKAKKLIALLLAAVCLCAMLTACGNKKTDEPEKPTGEAPAFATIGEALAAAENGSQMYSTCAKAFVVVVKIDDVYWRLAAELTPEQHDALWELDILDEDHDEKLKELTDPLPISRRDNLNEQMLTEEQLAALVGKTGEDLLNEGWQTGMGFNLETMEFYMEYPPFEYTVTFEAQEPLENTDDFDEEEAIRPLKVKSVAFFALGNSSTDIPEYMEEDE